MRTQLGLILGCLSLVACGGGDSDVDARPPADARVDAAPLPDAAGPDGGTALIPEELPSPLPSGPADLTVVTYNAGLIQVVLGAEQRKPLIQAAIKGLTVDVVCMEEIYWQYTKPHLFAAEMADTFPYAYWSWTGSSTQGSGLMLLSKHPLYRGREIAYTEGSTTTVDRLALGVTVVDADDDWSVNVLCTHLHAGLDPEDDYPIKGSEIDELATWANTEYPTGPTLLLGDFNCGPAVQADVCECDTDGGCDNLCDAADEQNYDKLLETWTDPFPRDENMSTSGHMQFIDMSLVPGLYPNEPSQRIDHCFYRDLTDEEWKSGNLVLTADPELDIGGGTTLHYLSDHYGVTCTFGPVE